MYRFACLDCISTLICKHKCFQVQTLTLRFVAGFYPYHFLGPFSKLKSAQEGCYPPWNVTSPPLKTKVEKNEFPFKMGFLDLLGKSKKKKVPLESHPEKTQGVTGSTPWNRLIRLFFSQQLLLFGRAVLTRVFVFSSLTHWEPTPQIDGCNYNENRIFLAAISETLSFWRLEIILSV